MKAGVILLLFLFLGSPLSSETEPAYAIYVSNADIHSRLERNSGNVGRDQPVRVIDLGALGYNLGIGVVYRPKGVATSAPVEHDDVTEIYHITKGNGVLVTGGILVDPKPRPSNSENVLKVNGPSKNGKEILGGMSISVSAGDVVIIPAGVPHWFRKIDESLTYLVVRVDPRKEILPQ